MNVIGIDVGAKGGVCALNGVGEVIKLEPMPSNGSKASPLDVFKLIKSVHEVGNTFGFIEKVHAFPGQGVNSMFSFGYHAGGLEMIFIALGIPYELVPPKTWQKQMFIGTEAKMPAKQRAYASVCRLAPHVDFTKSERSKIPHDGMIDAYLIAEYGLRKFAVVSR